jgi:hypothetical protein
VAVLSANIMWRRQRYLSKRWRGEQASWLNARRRLTRAVAQTYECKKRICSSASPLGIVSSNVAASISSPAERAGTRETPVCTGRRVAREIAGSSVSRPGAILRPFRVGSRGGPHTRGAAQHIRVRAVRIARFQETACTHGKSVRWSHGGWCVRTILGCTAASDGVHQVPRGRCR